MSLQPGMPPPVAGAWIERDFGDAEPQDRATRDEDGTPVGHSDVEADTGQRREEDPSEQAVNLEALDAFMKHQREEQPGEE